MKSQKPNRTEKSFYRRLWVAYLIDSGTNNVPALLESTGMPLRTLQATLLGMKSHRIELDVKGPKQNRVYVIKDWGPINKEWVKNHLADMQRALL